MVYKTKQNNEAERKVRELRERTRGNERAKPMRSLVQRWLTGACGARRRRCARAEAHLPYLVIKHFPRPPEDLQS